MEREEKVESGYRSFRILIPAALSSADRSSAAISLTVLQIRSLQSEWTTRPKTGRKFREDVCHRKDDEQLSRSRYDEAVDCISQCLKDRTHDDAVSCEEETKADDPKRGHADGKHMLRSVEQVLSRRPGNAWKMISPMAIMDTEIRMLNFMVWIIRFLFRAP